MAKILNLQVTLGCDKNCDACIKFFECTSPIKRELYDSPGLKKIEKRLKDIKYKIVVLSGKGGVGKSTVTANLAGALKKSGARVGILDSDFYGPSMPTMMGVLGKKMAVDKSGRGLVAVETKSGIKVASVASTIEQQGYVTWMGEELRWGLFSFLGETQWGELDFLLIDLPPGTGEETLNVMKAVRDLDGGVMVTMPSDLCQVVVGRCISLCQKAGTRVLGVIENMGTLECLKCGKNIDVFLTGGGEKVCSSTNVPFLGKIPLDPKVCDASDAGEPFVLSYPDSKPSKMFMEIAKKIAEDVGYKLT
ncbi:MAG: Mrp/NBP35 family ATP-binding protein [Thermodesulfobacteriota bacterium]|nr:Mrp/NBP35 family ATP-binding protein [Thermodesulfobacteriota bacterium]